MITVFRRLLETLGHESLKAQLLRGGIGSILIKILRTLLTLALAILLARALGAESYGIYSFIFALVSLVAIPAQLGLPALVVRETAKAQATENWGAMRGLWYWASSSACIFTITLILIASGLAWSFHEFLSKSQIDTLAWGLLLVPLITLGALRGAALQGLGKAVQGQLPESVLRPACFFMFVLICLMITHEYRLEASTAMMLHVLAASIAFFVGILLLHRELPEGLRLKPTPVYDARRWLASALPLGLIAAMATINTKTDIVMLGMFVNDEDVGVYSIAAQGGALVSFGLTAFAAVAMPYFARFHINGDKIRFQRLATVGARATLALALPVAIVFVLFGATILRLVFGAEFERGHHVLTILAIAHLIHAGFGVVGPLLNMANMENITAKGISITALCNIILNLLLIPPYGITGAAIATAITYLIWNLILWNAVRIHLGIDSSVFRLKFISSSNQTNWITGTRTDRDIQ